MSEIGERLTGYLSGGGLFNPELANHDAVRDLVIDCRAEIERLTAELADCNGWRLIPPPERRIKELEAALAEARELIRADACDCVDILPVCEQLYSPNGCPRWAKRQWLEKYK